MRVFDENYNIIENPDTELGKLVNESKQVTFRYDITQYEQGHYDVVKEYPNGGIDVAWVVDVPEEGKWVAYDDDGDEVDTDIVIPEDAPHEVSIPGTYQYLRYILYTDDELAEIAEKKRLQEEEQQKLENQQLFLEDASERMDEAESGVVDSQEAIAELGVLVDSNSISIEDLMNAIAELGAIVAGEQ